MTRKPATKKPTISVKHDLPDLKVLEVNLKDLHEDPENPNRMAADDFALLVNAVKQNGMLQPILVQREAQGFRIVDGHHRARAAEDAGFKKVWAVEWDGTPEMRAALGIGMNKLRGELDYGAVARVVAELAEAGWSPEQLTITGYSESEIDDLLKATEEITAEDVMQGATSSGAFDEDEADVGRPARPLVLELTFATRDELKKARAGLKKAAGKGQALGTGLLNLLGHDEDD